MDRQTLPMVSARPPTHTPLRACENPNRSMLSATFATASALLRGFLSHGVRSAMGSHIAAAFLVSVTIASPISERLLLNTVVREEDIWIGIPIQSSEQCFNDPLDFRWSTIGLSRFPSEWIGWMRWTRYLCDVRAMPIGANGCHADAISRYWFGTRGSQVQILSPRLTYRFCREFLRCGQGAR